jgi:O-antigen ligase
LSTTCVFGGHFPPEAVKMAGNDARSSTAQKTVSKFLILAIVVVLFSAFFVHQHKMHYSILGRKSGSMDEMATAIARGGNLERRVAFVLMGTFFLFLLIRRERYSFEFRGGLYWIIFFYIFWAFLSVIWADDFGLVTRRLIVFAIFCVSAFSLSLNIPLSRLSSIVLWTTLSLLLVGIYSEITAGTISVFSEGYRFAGTCHPEGQAMNSAMLLLAAMIMARSDRIPTRAFSWLLMFIAIYFLLLSRSRGPSVGVLIAVVVCKFYSAERSKILTYLYVGLVMFCVAFLVLGDAFLPLAGKGILLGRSAEQIQTLTGRIPLWAECMEYVKLRPILGYGFSGFWTGERVLAISDAHNWAVNSSHSAYIEILLNLGLVGLAIFLTMVLSAWWTARRVWRFRRDDGMAFALGLLTLWMADGLLSTPISGTGFVAFLALVVVFSIARESLEWRKVRSSSEIQVSSVETGRRFPNYLSATGKDPNG